MITLEEVIKSRLKKNPPQLKAGDTVRVTWRIFEGGKERTQPFEGIVIATHGGLGIDATFTIRKLSFNVGVERTFPVHSPNLLKVERLKSAKVKRAKLYWLRNFTKKKAFKVEKKDYHLWEEPEVEAELAKIEQEKARLAELKHKEEEEAKAKDEAQYTQAIKTHQPTDSEEQNDPKSQKS